MGSVASFAGGAAVPLGVLAASAVAADDRDASASRLAICSADAGLSIYDLAALTGLSLPAPVRTIGGACRDVAVDSDGSFWIATSTGLVRVDASGLDRARPTTAEGAPVAGVSKLAIAWGPTGREIWALAALDERVGDRARCPRPWLVVQPIEPSLSEAPSPRPDRAAHDAELLGNLAVVHALGATQHNARSQRQGLRGLASADVGLERLSLSCGQLDLRRRELVGHRRSGSRP